MARKHEEWTEVRTLIPPDVHRRLKKAAEDRGATMELVVREAIACGLSCAEPRMQGTGAGAGTGAR